MAWTLRVRTSLASLPGGTVSWAMPDDAYPIYNRGRTLLVLDRKDEAKADFTLAASSKFKQPKARKLAQQELDAMKRE